MRDSLQRYFKQTRNEAFCWEGVPDADAVTILADERKQIVTFIIENDFSKMVTEHYGMLVFFFFQLLVGTYRTEP